VGDLSALSWPRGSYAIGEFGGVNLVLSQFCEIYRKWRGACELGF
jgi:hypothetical protein